MAKITLPTKQMLEMMPRCACGALRAINKHTGEVLPVCKACFIKSLDVEDK